MSTRVVDTSDRGLPEFLEELLECGGVFIFPTDTVPGIGGDPWDRRPLARVARLKGRTSSQPFTLHLPSIDAALSYTRPDERMRGILERFLPGPYTFLLPSREGAPPSAVADGKVGLRVPRHIFFSQVMRSLDRPVFGTSVNRAGLVPLVGLEEILEQFPQVDLVVTGPAGSGVSSPVIDLTAHPPQAVRGTLPPGL